MCNDNSCLSNSTLFWIFIAAIIVLLFFTGDRNCGCGCNNNSLGNGCNCAGGSF